MSKPQVIYQRLLCWHFVTIVIILQMSIEKVWQMSNVKEKYWHLVLINDEENVRHNPSHRTVFRALIHHRALFHPKQITFISIAHSMTAYENRALSMSTLLSPCLMHSSLLPQTCGPWSQVCCQAGWQLHEWALGLKILFTRVQGFWGLLYFLPLVRNSRWKILLIHGRLPSPWGPWGWEHLLREELAPADTGRCQW